MKTQWALILGIIFAIIIAVFAVLNVSSVEVNYLFGTSDWPLILVILFSALLGAAISGFAAMFRTIRLNRRISELQKEMTMKENQIAAQQNELSEHGHPEQPRPLNDADLP